MGQLLVMNSSENYGAEGVFDTAKLIKAYNIYGIPLTQQPPLSVSKTLSSIQIRPSPLLSLDPGPEVGRENCLKGAELTDPRSQITLFLTEECLEKERVKAGTSLHPRSARSAEM